MALVLDPIVNLPFMYINGLNLSYSSTTQIFISAGQCRDSTNVFDIVIPAQLTLNTGTIGLNGLDKGTLGANGIYYVYIIADPQGYNPAGVILSLSNVAPQMPKGISPNTSYSIYRRIGAITTNSSSQVIKFYQSGNGSTRQIVYDSPLTLPVTATTSFSTVFLNTTMPSFANLLVTLNIQYTPAVASSKLSLNCYGSSASAANAQVVIQPFGSTSNNGYPPFNMMTGLNGGVPAVSIQAANTGDTITFAVAGYIDNL